MKKIGKVLLAGLMLLFVAMTLGAIGFTVFVATDNDQMAVGVVLAGVFAVVTRSLFATLCKDGNCASHSAGAGHHGHHPLHGA